MSFRGILGGLLVPRQSLGSVLPDEVPPGSEIQALSANSATPAHMRTIRPPGADRPSHQAGTLPPAPGRGSSTPPQRAPPPVLIVVIGARIDTNKTPTYFVLSLAACSTAQVHGLTTRELWRLSFMRARPQEHGHRRA
jgi:hypothetical protein